ncbi:MAG: hypothetical protein ACT4OM_00155 [Actinomycetota bacterium]
MQDVQGRSLARETTETFLLLIIASLTLTGYLGLALVLIQVAR